MSMQLASERKEEEEVPRYNGDLTKVQLYPDCPQRWPHLPRLQAYWDHQVNKLAQESPRLFGKRLAAVVVRRVQESLARGQGLPDE